MLRSPVFIPVLISRSTLALGLATLLRAAGGLIGDTRAQGTGITLHPGLTVVFSIYGGHSPTGEFLGDYEFVNRVTDVSGGGYRYSWSMTSPLPASGVQAVAAEDKKNGIIVREFWTSGDMSARGYVSYLALSDASFADLKAGKETAFQFDGRDNPRSVKPVGTEDLTTMINETTTTIHTIKVEGQAGGTFWIVDDPAFPLMIKGEHRSGKWMVTAISDSAKSEQQLVVNLQQAGEATTHAILFVFNSAEIQPDSEPVIASVGQYLKSNTGVRLEIQGHTDNIGGAPFNLALSKRRADAVKAYLVASGIDPGRLTANGYGLAVPVSDNATPEGRAENRRVVFRKR
jgi:outer membrane protein OmpA-like peptidoglycan-associated protein